MSGAERPAPPPIKADPDVRASGFFVLRTPLLPFDELVAWGEDLEAPGALVEPVRLEAALAADRDRLRGRLRALWGRPEVQDAIFVASPSLEEGVPSWLQDATTGRGQRVERALVRYVERMAARPTPFGLCAGCSVGTLGPRTRLHLAARTDYRRHTRLDMHYLCGLADALGRAPELKPALCVRPNSSLYRSAGRWRYIEARTDPDTRVRSHYLIAVDPTDYLDATLRRAAEGATPAALAAALAGGDVTRAEAEEYIGTLIANQVLVPQLEPPVTGPEAGPALAAEMGALAPGGPVAMRLAEAQELLAGIDAEGVGAGADRYREVARRLEELPGKAELPLLFQVDLLKPAPEATLGPRVVQEMLRGVEILRRLSGDRAEGDLGRFRAAFVERYESRELPLVEALDEESGIGFGAPDRAGGEPSPLLDKLNLVGERARREVPWGPREALLLRKLDASLRAGRHEVELDAQDLAELAATELPPLPDAFHVLATLAAASEEALDRGAFRLLLHGVDGPSGANLLARFCHGDAGLRARVEKHLREEENQRPEAVLAEIVHLPQGRYGNFICRPALRTYEIPYLGRCGVPADRQIPVTDLRVSVHGERVVLRSERLGRELLPRLTSAHNFDIAGVGLYRFLCAVARQGVAAGLVFDWGPLESAPFLPRVTAGALVLARARWRLGRRELEPLRRVKDARLYLEVQALRRRLALPRRVALADRDNLLPVDLDNVLSVESVAQLLHDRTEAVLIEQWPEADDLCARGPEGRFTHELVVPFVRVRAEAPKPQATPRPVAVRRSFPVGSEWLYAKLYTGTATLDRVLCDCIRPLVDALLAAGAADGWFFVRYGDPDWHLRLRLHGAPGRLGTEVLPALERAVSPLCADGRVWRVQLDQYEREVERYGGDEGMVLAERVFQADSEAALAIVETLDGDAGADARWRLALLGIDRLLDDLGLDFEARRAEMRGAREEFSREHRVDAAVRRRLGRKFSAERAALEALLDPERTESTGLAPGVAIYRARSAALAPIVRDLHRAEESGRLGVPVRTLAGCFIHMHANRLLRSEARAQELALYDFLARLYDGQVARRKGSRD